MACINICVNHFIEVARCLSDVLLLFLVNVKEDDISLVSKGRSPALGERPYFGGAPKRGGGEMGNAPMVTYMA